MRYDAYAPRIEEAREKPQLWRLAVGLLILQPEIVAVSPAGSAWSSDFGRSWAVFDTLEHWTVDFVHAGAGWAAGRGVISRIRPGG